MVENVALYCNKTSNWQSDKVMCDFDKIQKNSDFELNIWKNMQQNVRIEM